MEEPKVDTVNSQDQTYLTEPIREKLQETAISPIDQNGSLSDDDPMAITRRQSKRARDHGEDDGVVPPLEQERRKRAATTKKAEDEDAHITDAPASATESAIQSQPKALTQPTITLDTEAAPVAATNGAVESGRKTPETDVTVESAAVPKDIASPIGSKRRRSEFQEDVDEPEAAPREKTASLEPDIAAKEPATSNTERATKRQRSESPKEAPSTAKIPASSGFANTSASSPFGALAKSNSDHTAKPSGFGNTSSASPFGGALGAKPTASSKETSASAFASSGFGSFAGQTASPFGAAKANGTSSVFAAPAASTPSAFSTPSTGKLGFGSSGGGFGALGSTPKMSGFGGSAPGSGFGGLASGPKLTGFGGPQGTTMPPITGLKGASASAFGAPAAGNEDDEEGSSTEPDEDGEDGDDEEGKDKVAAVSAKNKAEPVHISNGEENEESLFISRAKLFAFVPDEKGQSPAWRERGTGTLKINIDKDFAPEEDEDDAESGLIQGTAEFKKPKKDEDKEDTPAVSMAQKSKARFVMRQDSTNKLIFNSPVMPGTLYGTEPATPMTVILLGMIPGYDEPQKLQLKMKADQIKNFWSLVSRMQGDGS